MSSETLCLIVNNIKLPTDASFEEAFSVASSRLNKAGIRIRKPAFSVYKRSVDARRRDDIKFVYSVAVTAEFTGVSEYSLSKAGAALNTKSEKPKLEPGSEVLNSRPLVVGSGPAGLFAALLLAEWGYKPVLIERGGSVSERKKAINDFKITRILDTDTNIQFGAGGAGTFSDGKLVTRINDGLCNYVLEKFVEFGAPEEILYLAKPHIGTDILCEIVDKIIDKIVELGGEVRYHTRLIDVSSSDGKIRVAKTNTGDIPCGAVILAIGHSARDTYEMLLSRGVSIEAKNFSVGMRIEHLALDIDKAMYGDKAGDPILGHAEYTLSHNTKERGVYTFCMCPGGEVVAATSENGGVVVNGMSHHARDGRNSNSAVVCSVFKEDYGATVTKAIEFQRKIERAAFIAGGSDYSAPIITFGDFVNNKACTDPSRILPTYMDGGVKLALPEAYLPSFICDSIKNAIHAFDGKINGFASPYAVLTGAETRTSAPVRILRNNDSRLAIGFDNLYPTGEGAGYAGGITSAAVDGLKTAITLINRYSPVKLG